MRIVTLSFDDGFEASNRKVAAVYEKFGLSACFNVLAGAHLPEWSPPVESLGGLGDFGLWRELLARGHEIMPHGFRHANKTKIPVEEAQDLTLRCLDVFEKELPGFRRENAVYNFPFNASTDALEKWLPTVVRAFRTWGDAINPMPSGALVKLTCSAFGPENCEADLDKWVDTLLRRPSGWLIYNTHGVDGEGWGPIASAYLERLIDRLLSKADVRVLPAGRALMMAASGAVGPVESERTSSQS